MAVRYLLDNPVIAGGHEIRALVKQSIRSGGSKRNIYAQAEKHPVALLIKGGQGVRVLAMNGEEVSATDLRSLTERCPELAQHLQVDHRSASGT